MEVSTRPSSSPTGETTCQMTSQTETSNREPLISERIETFEGTDIKIIEVLELIYSLV